MLNISKIAAAEVRESLKRSQQRYERYEGPERSLQRCVMKDMEEHEFIDSEATSAE